MSETPLAGDAFADNIEFPSNPPREGYVWPEPEFIDGSLVYAERSWTYLGDKGDRNVWVLNTHQGETYKITQGPEGPQGIQGITGETGSTGATGPSGDGIVGSSGPRGVQGEQGASGVQGERGPEGTSKVESVQSFMPTGGQRGIIQMDKYNNIAVYTGIES